MVKEILTLLGHEVDDDELDEVMEEFDEDENGTIEFPEFIKMAEEFVEPEQDYNEAKKDLREVFLMYDKDQKGYIPVADFKLILKELDSDLPDTEAEQIVKELDTDGSGTIDFEGSLKRNNFHWAFTELSFHSRIHWRHARRGRWPSQETRIN